MEIQIYVINEYFGIIVINKSRDTRCQVPLNFYKQIYTYLQITNIVVE